VVVTLLNRSERRVEAVVLSATPDNLRVAVPGESDVVDLRIEGGRWVAEDGVTLDLDFWLAEESDDLSIFDGFVSTAGRMPAE
jgi:hypothetical protein